MTAKPSEIPAPFDFDQSNDDMPEDSFWAEGIYYVYDESTGEFVAAATQPDDPIDFIITPEGRTVPAD